FVGAGVGMFVSFWLLLAVVARAFWRGRGTARPFVLAGCAALAVGTLQGPVQAVPAVNELLERGGDAGDVIVNLHAQLNMLGGLMVLLVGAVLALLRVSGVRGARAAFLCVPAGTALYYAAGLAFSVLEGRAVAGGESFGAAVQRLEPWSALVLVPAAAAVLVRLGGYARAA